MKLKIFIAIRILAIASVIAVATGLTEAAKPVITADSTYFDASTGLYVLDGNVRVEVRNRIMTAAHAKVSLSSMEVWGTGGVTFQKGQYYFSGGSVYVYGRKNYAKIDGGVDFSLPNLHITADRAEYNWETSVGIFRGNVHVTQNGESWTSDTVVYNIDKNEFQ